MCINTSRCVRPGTYGCICVLLYRETLLAHMQVYTNSKYLQTYTAHVMVHGSWTCQRRTSLLHAWILLLLASWYLTLLHNQLHISTIITLVQPPQHMAWMTHGSLRDNSLESATEFFLICWTCISYLWCVAYCSWPLIVTTVTALPHFIQGVIVLCTNWLAGSEGSEHCGMKTYVTNIKVHIQYMHRSIIMKRIYSVNRQARPSKVVVLFCFLNSPHHRSLMQSRTF